MSTNELVFIEIPEKYLLMKVGELRMLKAKLIPENYDNQTLTWETNNDNAVRLVQGATIAMVTAKKLGVAKITLTVREYWGGGRYSAKSEHCYVRVVDPSVFWCQTGGWNVHYYPDKEGVLQPKPLSQECARTAVATMASINSGFTVNPNAVTGSVGFISIPEMGIELIEASYFRKGWDGDKRDSYNDKNNVKFNQFSFTTQDKLLKAINNELNHGRAVVVKTNGAGEHWVTVVKTKDGKQAESFSDLWGIDPWFNGANPKNQTPRTPPHNTIKDGGCGVVKLHGAMDTQTKFFGSDGLETADYAIFTFNFD